tara:strand:- start:1400 stop:2050 length:651 start_codon:yes stop_codon:yes gene_type:complete
MATKKLTKNQAVSICYCAMILADGKVDPNELAWAHESPIASKYEVDKNRKWISEILQEGGNLSEYTAQLPTPELKRMTVDERNAITGDLMILSAIDGKADEKELKLLYPTYLLLGGNDEDFNAFMQKMQDAMEKNRGGGGCFIATATMGNYDHPVVMDLRTFRDETLKRSIAGRIFIYFYYKIGPLFASIIEQSRTLRNLSFKFLIKPLHSLVSKK